MNARQSTAKTFLVGPVLDEDGVAVTTLDEDDFKVSKAGAPAAALDGGSTATHDVAGHYLIASAADDFDTVGSAQFICDSGTNAMTPVNFDVIEASRYDDLYVNRTGWVPNWIVKRRALARS
jgi:hypothetical protein